MSQQVQSGRRIDLTISIPHNNSESICPPGLWKLMYHTAATESDIKKPLYDNTLFYP